MARTFTFETAHRENELARMALWGPSGAGKTYTAIKIAYTLTDGGRVGVIDTENRSASLYADMASDRSKNPEMAGNPTWTFRTVDFKPPYDPRLLSSLIEEHSSNFDALVIDSFSAFWSGEGGLMDIKDGAPGKEFQQWKTATPIQNRVMESILRAKCHIIVCMRSKTLFDVSKDERGRTTVAKLGLGPVQRDTTIYEMTVAGSLDTDHKLSIEKTRCSALDGNVYSPNSSSMRTEHFALTLKDWLGSSEAAVATQKMLSDAEATRQRVETELDEEITKESDDVTVKPNTTADDPTIKSNATTDDIKQAVLRLGGSKSPQWEKAKQAFGFDRLAEVSNDQQKMNDLLNFLQ